MVGGRIGRSGGGQRGYAPLVALVFFVFVGVITFTLLLMLTDTTLPNCITRLEQSGYSVYAASELDSYFEVGDCYPTDFIPCADDVYELGSNTSRWERAWLGSDSLRIGTLEISNSAQQMDIDGQLVLHDAGKVWLEIQPDLDYATVQAFGKPTQVYIGAHSGFSLPIYNNDNEELFVQLDVPREWDGETNPIVHIHTVLYQYVNNSKRFNLEVGWGNFSPEAKDVVSYSVNLVEEEIITDPVTLTRTSFLVEIELDYDVVPSNPLTVCDELGLRLRRKAASQDEITGEVMVTHIGVQFLRDKLGTVTPNGQ